MFNQKFIFKFKLEYNKYSRGLRRDYTELAQDCIKLAPRTNSANREVGGSSLTVSIKYEFRKLWDVRNAINVNGEK